MSKKKIQSRFSNNNRNDFKSIHIFFVQNDLSSHITQRTTHNAHTLTAHTTHTVSILDRFGIEEERVEENQLHFLRLGYFGLFYCHNLSQPAFHYAFGHQGYNDRLKRNVKKKSGNKSEYE